jgi:hypothetical protein
VIRCSEAQVNSLGERLAAILKSARGGACPVTIEYTGGAASGALALGPEWTVRASREVLEQLEGLLGPGAVQVVYAALPAAATFSADGR